MEATSREEVFESLRAKGIKAIKVVAADGSKANGEETGEGGRESTRASTGEYNKRTTARRVAAAALIAATIGGGAWWWATRTGDQGQTPAQFIVNTPQGPVTYRIADPLPRQSIPGNRHRIEEGRDTIFTNAAERLLARFAEPGRAVAAPDGEKPTEGEFAVCLREPVRVASTDFTEVSDLKRIVAGLKREMRAYLAGGGTVEQYLAELAKRQRLEISYRENAEQKLAAMLEATRQGTGKTASAQQQGAGGTASVQQQGAGVTASVQQQGTEAALRKAYDYWLKANASLKSMGIYELPLPDALQAYQVGLDIEE